MKRLWRGAALAGWGVALLAMPALAEGGESSPADSPTGWIFRWINFAIVLGLIVWAFSKAAPYFRRHAEEITEKIAEGTRAREAAEAKSREAQAKLGELDKEVAAMRAAAKKDMEAEIVRLKAQTKEEAATVEETTNAEIEAAERAARMELKAIAADMAIARAEAMLRERMTPQTDAALLKTYVAELERSVN